MLDTLRKGAGTWVVKIFLGILVLSFAIWGIGDIFRIRADTAVAEIGDTKISQTAYLREFNRDLQAMQRQTGGNLDAEQARQLGLAQQTLDRLVAQALLDEAARRMGLLVGDDIVRQEILSSGTFKDETGAFSAQRFELVLSRNGYTEQSFVAQRKQQLAREQLFTAVTAGGQLSKLAVETIYRFQRQRRVAEVLRLPHKAFEPAAAADATVLAEYHKAHATRYTAPELRALSFIVLNAEDLQDEVAVDPAEVRQVYEQRQSEFQVPEQREVEQILVPEEKLAIEIAGRLSEGGEFYAVAKQLAGQDEARVKLGALARGTLPQAVDDVVFALGVDRPSTPVQSPFGWHVLRVTAIAPGHQRGFEDVRQTLERELRLERAQDALYAAANRITDTLAGGATLEEVAQQQHLELKRIAAVDARGRALGGALVGGLPEIEGFLEAAFAANPGDEPTLVEAAAGAYYALRVDGITQAAPRPLDDVRAQVLADWTAEQARQSADAQAKALAERLRAGEGMEALTKVEGYSSLTTAPLTRAEAGTRAGLDRAAVEVLFKLKIGDVGVGEGGAGTAAVVFRLKEVVETDPKSEPEGVKQMGDGLQRLLLADLADGFRQALDGAIGVAINQRAADSALQQGR
jgi:peptidyl-prolyl cis-trans isomerase D